MGANSSAQSHPEQLRDEVDAPDSLVPPSRLGGQATARHKYLLSLDRSMKSFLRASNLSGLEYRLRLAGYHTFHDLLSADRETLESKGFTGIMARRLLRAVSDYLRRQLSRSEEERLPFRLVRRGQRIQTEPSDNMRDNPNYRRRNVKRQKSSGEDSGRKATGGGVLHLTQTPSQVRLMAESDLNLQHLISPPPEVATTAQSGDSVEESAAPEGGEDGEMTNGGESSGGLLPPEGNRGQKILGVIVKDDDALLVVEDPSSNGEDPLISELDDAQLREEALLSLNQLRQPPTGPSLAAGLEETDSGPISLPRSFSVPANLELTCLTSEDFVFTRTRAFSCTVSPLAMRCPHN